MKHNITIAIDGGDFYPYGIVNSGIKRIVDSFLKNIGNEYSQITINYYYFGSAGARSSRNIYNGKFTLNIKRLPTRFFSSIFLPLQTIKDKNDAFIGFSMATPYILGYTPIKKLSFIYDLGFINYADRYNNLEKIIDNTNQTIIISDKIIVLSQFAKRSLMESIHVYDTKKILVKYPGNDHLMNIEVGKAIKKDDYFLYVGVVKPVKNIERLIDIYTAYRDQYNKKIQLVLIGSQEEEYYKILKRKPEYVKYHEDIIFLGNIPDKDLVNYYTYAKAVVNVSKVEGLGFPVLEALAFGKVVIVNDIEIYREFSKKYKNLWIGKTNLELVELLKNAHTGKYSHKRTPQYTWKEFTEFILNTLIKLVDKR